MYVSYIYVYRTDLDKSRKILQMTACCKMSSCFSFTKKKCRFLAKKFMFENMNNASAFILGNIHMKNTVLLLCVYVKHS